MYLGSMSASILTNLLQIDSEYQWPTGGAVVQSMWGPGQPSDNQQCSQMKVNGNNNPIDDVSCSTFSQYICEISKDMIFFLDFFGLRVDQKCLHFLNFNSTSTTF